MLDPELEAHVHARLQEAGAAFARRTGGQFFARVGRLDGASPYMLTGHLTCARYRGPLGGRTQLHGTGPASRRQRVTYYECVHHARRGPTICRNDHKLKTAIIDEAILTALRRVITPDMIEEAVRRALADLGTRRAALEAQRVDLTQQLAEVDTGLSRIVAAITAGGPLETLVVQLKIENSVNVTSALGWPRSSPPRA